MGIDLGDLEGFHKSFLRSSVGMHNSVNESVLMLDLNRHPIVFFIAKQVMGFAERVWRRVEGDVVKAAQAETLSWHRMVCVCIGQRIFWAAWHGGVCCGSCVWGRV